MGSTVHSYGEDELQKLKVFQQSKSSQKAIVFIHGGGWRDPNNTFDDFKDVLSPFQKLEYNVISINYRLSPKTHTEEEFAQASKLWHPFHLIDIVSALSFITLELGLEVKLLVGHSVGSSLILQLLNYQEIIKLGLQEIEADPSTIPSQEEWAKMVSNLSSIQLKNVVFLDGIFNVESMLNEYGDSYRLFVSSAFTSDDHFKKAFPLSNEALGPPHYLSTPNTTFYIIHSLEDELLSPAQSEECAAYFKKHSLKYEFLPVYWGKHEEIYTRQELADFLVDHL